MQTRVVWDETIDESSSLSETKYFNWAQIFSSQNRRYLPQVDEKGNAFNYIVAIKQSSPDHTGNSQVKTTISTANGGYVTKAAIKAWHRARVKMLRREGLSLKSVGPYMRSLRFGLNVSNGGGGTSESELADGEWTVTRIAAETAMDSADASDPLEADNIIDDYTLTLCDDSVATGSAEGGGTKYTTVGIIASWLDSRRSKADFISADTAIDHEANPLYNLLSGSLASEEVLEIVQDNQAEEPPYGDDSKWDDLFPQAELVSAVNAHDSTIVTCPAGLMQAVVTSVNTDDNTATDSSITWTVELLDIVPM